MGICFAWGNANGCYLGLLKSKFEHMLPQIASRHLTLLQVVSFLHEPTLISDTNCVYKEFPNHLILYWLEVVMKLINI